MAILSCKPQGESSLYRTLQLIHFVIGEVRNFYSLGWLDGGFLSDSFEGQNFSHLKKKLFYCLEGTSLLIISSSPGLIILPVTQQSHCMDPHIMLLLV